MSLILRKTCQEVLDKAGLQNTHCRINDSKNLVIAGECGQPLVTISGIAFARKDPTMNEITYAAELLDSFLVKHLTLLNQYMVVLSKYRATPVPPNEDKKNGITYHEKSYRLNQEQAEFTDEISEDGRGVYYVLPWGRPIMMSTKEYLTPAEWSSYQVDTKRIKIATDGLRAFHDYQELGQQVNDLLAKLNMCEI